MISPSESRGKKCPGTISYRIWKYNHNFPYLSKFISESRNENIRFDPQEFLAIF